MRMNFHNDDECYLLFGKELNKIIAMLQNRCALMMRC